MLGSGMSALNSGVKLCSLIADLDSELFDLFGLVSQPRVPPPFLSSSPAVFLSLQLLSPALFELLHSLCMLSLCSLKRQCTG